MNINLKNYQEKAVEEIITKVKTLLSKEGQKKVCVFQAPTGSGKTLMTAKFIEELIKELPGTDLCFLWVSIGKGELHLQSKYSLERIFGGAPRVSLVEEEFTGGRERIVRNEVVVVNWEKLRSKDQGTRDWKNVLMKDGEKLNFRDVLSKTHEQRKIVMIIDESHIGANAERTNELRDEINADVILEMSATPRFTPDPKDIARGTSGYVFVEPKDVIEEGMIKKEIIINDKIREISSDEKDSQEVVLEAAYQKRLELTTLFTKEGSNINPLVLIQIPTAEAGDEKIKAIKEFLAKRKITERKDGSGNGRLAIWLSEQKSETLEWVSELDNEIEFLIFKQAIDTGWDCPRAHILVKFRESHSETFEIQTVGRILRMPEQRHYFHEDLNIGYIYTNVESIIVKKEDYNPNIIKHLRASKKDIYEDIKLKSYYKSRADYGDVTSSFSFVFNKIANEYFGIKDKEVFIPECVRILEKKGIVMDVVKYEESIIADTSLDVKSFDELLGNISPESLVKLQLSSNDLYSKFEEVIKRNLGPFKNVKRSVPAVKTAIYVWFGKYLGSKKWSNEALIIQKIFIFKDNLKIWEELLSEAIGKYKAVKDEEVRDRIINSELNYDYELPDELYFNQHADQLVAHEKYIYDFCYLDINRSAPEKKFEEFLEDEKNNVLWWWKNGENKQDYFGIKYEYPDGVIHTFYPDYIVKLSNGKLGIIEVKDANDREGQTYTKVKAERLYEYVNSIENNNIFGGIVINHNGVWKLNQKKEYNWSKCEKNDWSDWDKLIL